MVEIKLSCHVSPQSSTETLLVLSVSPASTPLSNEGVAKANKDVVDKLMEIGSFLVPLSEFEIRQARKFGKKPTPRVERVYHTESIKTVLGKRIKKPKDPTYFFLTEMIDKLFSKGNILSKQGYIYSFPTPLLKHFLENGPPVQSFHASMKLREEEVTNVVPFCEDGLWPHQIEAIRNTIQTMADQDHFLRNEFMLDGRFGVLSTCIQMPPGSGKTRTAFKLANIFFGEKVIDSLVVLVHTRKLLDQWNELAITYGNGIPFACLTLQGISSKWKGLDGEAFLNSLRAKGKSWPWDKSMLILDEVHHVPAKMFTNVVSKAVPSSMIRMRIGLSASMTRKDGLGPILPMVMNKPCYSLLAIDMDRVLDKLYVYDVKFGTKNCSEVFLSCKDDEFFTKKRKREDLGVVDDFIDDGGDDVFEHPEKFFGRDGVEFEEEEELDVKDLTLNKYMAMLRTHSVCEARATWILQECVISELIRSQQKKHVLVFVYLINHAKLLVCMFEKLFKERGRDFLEGIEIASQVGKTLSSKFKKKCDALNLLVGNTNFAHKITIATMHAVGEGYDDTTITGLVFTDPALDTLQNGNRIRDSAHGTICYIMSSSLRGGKERAKKDINEIKNTLYTKITEEKKIDVDLD